MKFTSAGVETWIQDLSAQTGYPGALSAANPSVCTVSGAIGEFTEGGQVTLSGYSGAAAAANGTWTIDNIVGSTFEVVGLDLSAATGGPFNGLATPSGPALLDIVSLTNAKPAVATLSASDAALITEGEAILVAGTGTSLDGRAFRAKSVGTPANTVTLEGSDLSSLSAPVVQGTLQPVSEGDMLKICLTSLEDNMEGADPLDASTMCGPEQLAGIAQPGDINIEGYVDYFEAAQMEWLDAAYDNQRRLMRVKIPAQGGGGEILYVITPSSFTQTFEVSEIVSFSGTAVKNVRPTYYTGPNA